MKRLSHIQSEKIIYFIIDQLKEWNPNIDEDSLYEEISQDWFPQFDNSMKLISYDDLLWVMSREELDKLPTIDPISTIDEMIEEVNNPWKEWESKHKTQVLQELKSRLSLNKK